MITPWRAIAEVIGELMFIVILVLLAEDYGGAVIAFLAALWILFLAANPHPWRSQQAAA